MEAIKRRSYKVKKQNLRQSENWLIYLQSLGWKHIETTSGVKIALLKTPLGKVVKIQRPSSLSKKDLAEIETICKKNKALFIKIEPGIKQNQEILINAGYELSSHPLCPPSTVFIDLRKSEKDLWENISRSGKYSINRAKREGSVVSFTNTPTKQEVDEYYHLVQKTGKFKRFYTEPPKDTHLKVKIFGDKATFGLVYNPAKELMGIKFFVANEDTVTFLLGGTSQEGRKGKWGYALLWESILYFKKLGYKYLDLEGVDDSRFPTFTKNWGGFSHFKEKFGGEVVRYLSPHIKYLNPVFKMLSKILPIPF